MKKLLFIAILVIAAFRTEAQTNSVFHLKTVYTPQNGYQYFFCKIDPQTGTSTQISQLPIIGYYTGYAFFNCYNHYVFQGIDTLAANGDYINKLYEMDTLGNVVRTIAMDTTTGTWYKYCLPSANTPYYYALRWNTVSQQYNIEKIDANNGTRTFQVLSPIALYLFLNSDATITSNDIIWMGMVDQMTASEVLISLNPNSGTLSFEDTLSPGYYYDCLVYDCPDDTIYGFIAHQDSVQGSELLKIHGNTSTVIHSGTTANGTGQFLAGSHTRLPNGSCYVRTSTQNYWLPDFNVTAPTFSMPVASASSVNGFCFASPRGTCANYTPCVPDAIGENSLHPSLNVFPNPSFGGSINIQTKGFFCYELIDVTGKVAQSGTGSDLISVPTATLNAGMYFVRVIQNDATFTQKIMIQN